ncbi:MAG: MBL fold metallo-hydrolase, partial [Bacillota bacterium]|nr:MBL fold metallo-hydrolase [Bacillota bacterium]
IDLAIVTHLHQDHYGGIASLARLMPVEALALYEGNRQGQEAITEETGLSAGALRWLAAGDRIRLDREVWIDVLWPEAAGEDGPPPDQEDENANSLLLQVNYRGVRTLMTADMGSEGEGDVLELYGSRASPLLEAHILKVGHHGSRYSTSDAFLAAVDPGLAVIQVGRNHFGHPHPEVLEKLEENDIMVYDTLQNGAVLVYIEDGGARVRTMQ